MSQSVHLFLKLEKLDSSLCYVDIVLTQKQKNNQILSSQLERNLCLNAECVELQYELSDFTRGGILIQLSSRNVDQHKVVLHDLYVKNGATIIQLLEEVPIYKMIKRSDPLYHENLDFVKGKDIKNSGLFNIENFPNPHHVFNFEKYLRIGSTRKIEITDQFQLDFTIIS